MSLLDDLKKQAEQKATRDTVQASSTTGRADQVWKKLEPKMKMIARYYKELAENLNIVNPDTLNSYQLTKSIVLNNLKKTEFRVTGKKANDFRCISFRYDLTGERDIKVAINNDMQAEKIRSVLSERGFRFVDKVEHAKRIVFTIKPKITVLFEYSVDLENAQVLLKVDNFDGAWTQLVRYNPDAVNEELLDETAKYILKKPNRFQQLSGNVVSEDMRAKLRATLMKSGKIPNEKDTTAQREDKMDSTTIRLKSLFKKK